MAKGSSGNAGFGAVVFNRFEGGWGTDSKTGMHHSQAYTQALDFRKNPSQLTVLPALAKESGAVVTDLIQNFVMVTNGTIYSIGDTGNLYSRSTAGVWSLVGNIGGAGYFGMDYRTDTDNIYICGATTVSIYGPVTGTPTLTVNKYGASTATANTSTTTGFNVNPNQTGSGYTYTPPVTPISEVTTNLRYFQSDIEPLSKVSIYIQTKGTGNWTVTLHDGLNNSLASVTVANASLNNNMFNDFVFTTPIRAYVSPSARTYHIHVTSTVADGSMTTSANGDLKGADLQVYANRLIATNNGLHPMARFLQYEVIGNGNYLSVWEPISDPPTNAEWVRHRLFFPQDYEVCGTAVFNEYLAVALQKVSSNATSNPQDGLIAFWDGLSTLLTPVYFTKVPEDTPQCLKEYKNAIWYYAGGSWWRISAPTSQPEKMRTFPGSDTEYSGGAVPITINPYAATVRRGILLMAYPSVTTSTTINYGVYSWGHIDRNWPESFGYNYLISTASQNYSASNNLKIGAIKSFGDTFLVSWRDDLNGGYGVDSVTNASNPSTTSSWQSLIIDHGITSKEKTGYFIKVTVPTFPTDVSIVVKYKLDRNANWTSSTPFTTANASKSAANGSTYVCRFDLNLRYTEIQLGIDITSGTTTPVISSAVLAFNSNVSEEIS